MNKIVRIGNRKNNFSYFLTNCLHIPEYSDANINHVTGTKAIPTY